MNEVMRPLTLGEILDRTLNFYRSRFLLFLGISILPTTVMVLIGAVAGGALSAWVFTAGRSMPDVARTGAEIVLLALAALLALPLILGAAALSNAALQQAVGSYYRGEAVTIRSAYKAVWKRGWTYLGLYALQILLIWMLPVCAMFGIFMLIGVVGALGAQAGGGAAGAVLVGLLALVVFAALVGYLIWMLLQLSLAFPACVIEQISPVAAMKRSWKLVNGTRGRIFVLYLLVTVLGWMVAGGVQMIAFIIGLLVNMGGSSERRQLLTVIVLVLSYAGQIASQALTKPLYGIALALFYYDQRIRQEGFDIEWMMYQAGLVVPEPAGALPVAAQAAVAHETAAEETAPVAPAIDTSDTANGEAAKDVPEEPV
jgi:hypothetical protein